MLEHFRFVCAPPFRGTPASTNEDIMHKTPKQISIRLTVHLKENGIERTSSLYLCLELQKERRMERQNERENLRWYRRREAVASEGS
ncbi:hypothetical protein TNCV_169531 [Trichonephila clavipes]|nr:hypothetical protein TNCV_169531 [Trichonephila clavipes]